MQPKRLAWLSMQKSSIAQPMPAAHLRVSKNILLKLIYGQGVPSNRQDLAQVLPYIFSRAKFEGLPFKNAGLISLLTQSVSPVHWRSEGEKGLRRDLREGWEIMVAENQNNSPKGPPCRSLPYFSNL